jgi:hypothetical protein
MEKGNISDYEASGCASRKEYLDSLCEDYDVDPMAVYALADVLGPGEDFDGLVTSLEDFDFFGW